MSDQRSPTSGIRAIAIFEAMKSVFLFVVGSAILSLLHQNAEAAAVDLIRYLHLNPARHYLRGIVTAFSHVTDTEILLVASFALLDAVVRAIEAIGLWFHREWAKWLSIVTATLYLPIEIYEIGIHITWLKMFAFVTNLAIVIYLCTTLKSHDVSAESKL